MKIALLVCSVAAGFLAVLLPSGPALIYIFIACLNAYCAGSYRNEHQNTA